jgi:hypothetical protein
MAGVGAVVFALTACDSDAAGAPNQKRHGMKSMNCTTLKADEFEQALAAAKAQAPKSADAKRPVVRVNFEVLIPGVQAAQEKDTWMLIQSERRQAAVFSGPYSERFSVAADAQLTDDKGADSLRFEYYRGSLKQVCVWEQDRAEPYWQANAIVKVRFLDGRQIDERTGRAIAFVVEVTVPR